MKKLYILSLSLLSIATVNAQVVLTSNLSSWSGGLPTDFMGTKSNISASNVTEITTGAEYGTSLAQLTETTTTHKRFTTKPISVTSGQGYEVKVWAKGQVIFVLGCLMTIQEQVLVSLLILLIKLLMQLRQHFIQQRLQQQIPLLLENL
jgi:hypothetical protein